MGDSRQFAVDKLHSLMTLSAGAPMGVIKRNFAENFGFEFPCAEFGCKRIEEVFAQYPALFVNSGGSWKAVTGEEFEHVIAEVNLAQRGGRSGGRGAGRPRGAQRGRAFVTTHGAAFNRNSVGNINQRTTFPKDYRGANFQTSSLRGSGGYNNTRVSSHQQDDPHARIYERSRDIYNRQMDDHYNDHDDRAPHKSYQQDDAYDSYDDRYHAEDREYGEYSRNSQPFQQDRRESHPYDEFIDRRSHVSYHDYDESYHTDARSPKENDWDYAEDRYSRDPCPPPPGLNIPPPGLNKPAGPPGLKNSVHDPQQVHELGSEQQSHTSSGHLQITSSAVMNEISRLFENDMSPIPMKEIDERFMGLNEKFARSVKQYKGGISVEDFVRKHISKAVGKLAIDREFLVFLKHPWWSFYKDIHAYLKTTGRLPMGTFMESVQGTEDSRNAFKKKMIKVYMNNGDANKGLCRAICFLPLERPDAPIMALDEEPDSDPSIYFETIKYMPELLPEHERPLRFRYLLVDFHCYIRNFRKPLDPTPTDPGPSMVQSAASLRSGSVASFHSANEDNGVPNEEFVRMNVKRNSPPPTRLKKDLPPIVSHTFQHYLSELAEEDFEQYEGERVHIVGGLEDLSMFWIIFERDGDRYSALKERISEAWCDPVPSLHAQFRAGDAAILRQENDFYRVNLVENPRRDKVLVERVDAGGRELVAIRSLSSLHKDLLNEPALALRCGVVPYQRIDEPKYQTVMDNLLERLSRLPYYSLILTQIQMFANDGRFIVDISVEGKYDLRRDFFRERAIRRLKINI